MPDKYISTDIDADFDQLDDNSKCHGCSNNTAVLCPYRNDGNGECDEPVVEVVEG